VIHKLSRLDFLQEFTFVGGSALSVYLNHRYSQDIDLFTWQEALDWVTIQNQLKQGDFGDSKVLNLSTTEADLLLDGVKVTFFANNWNALKKRASLEQNLYIADLAILAVMKVNALFLRATFRDYYDLYVLNLEHFTLQELFDLTVTEMTNLTDTLFQRALVFTDDIEDEDIAYLKPRYEVSLKEIRHHFELEIKKWNQQ